VPLALVAAIAFGLGAVAGAGVPERGQRAVERFARAWEAGDRRAMYAQLSARARRRTSPRRFEEAYKRAGAIATIRSVRTGTPARDGDAWRLPVSLRTRIFGTLRGRVRLPIDGDGDGERPGSIGAQRRSSRA
jgi:hypothetical protein